MIVGAGLGCGDDDAGAVDAGGGMDAPMGEDAGGEQDAGTDSGVTCDPGEVPLARGEHVAALDESRGRLVMYGGNTLAPQMCRPRFNATDELWVYDLACGTWEQITEAGAGPGARVRANLVVDAANDRAILFGGRFRDGDSGPYTNFDDVWTLDLGALTWSQIATSGEGPSARNNSAVGFDADAGVLYVFGGNVSTSGLTPTGTNDLYALDLASGAWRTIEADGPPPPRYYHDAVLMDGELFVFGGTPDFDGPFRNDVWAFDTAAETWRMVSGGGPDSPASRFGAALFADAERGRLIMAAGHDSTDLGNVNDLWTLDPATGTWAEVVHGDTLNGRASGPCMFPDDFTIPDMGAPERRHGFGMARGATTSYVVFGKTDCGNVNDVWAIDHATVAWSLHGSASTAGEACNRSGATECTELCF